MKGLRILLFLVAIILLAGFVLNYISPNDVEISESMEIDAPKEVVYSHINKMSELNKWQPWLKIDPDAKVTIEGDDGSLGAKSMWDSQNKNVGAGEQEFVKLVPNERVETKLRFKSPQESEADAYLQLDDAGDGKTKVTWGFSTHATFPGNIFMKFMESQLRDSFKKGLTDLGAMASESAKNPGKTNTSATTGYKFEEVTFPTTKFLIKRDKVEMAKIGEFYQSTMGNLYTAMMAADGQMAGAPTGLYYDWDEEAGVTDMAAAVPVATDLNIEGFEMVTVESGLCLKTTHNGSYDASPEAHYAIDAYMKANGYEVNGLVMEQYLNDPQNVASPDELLTDIYYFVKKN